MCFSFFFLGGGGVMFLLQKIWRGNDANEVICLAVIFVGVFPFGKKSAQKSSSFTWDRPTYTPRIPQNYFTKIAIGFEQFQENKNC